MSIYNTLPFATIPEWLLDAPVSDRAVRLFGLLVRYADRDGHAHPSRRALADRLRCSTDSVDRAMRELIEMGVVEVRERHRDDGSQTSNELILRPGGRMGAEGGSRTAAEGGGRTAAAPKNESHIEREPFEIERVNTLSISQGPDRSRAAPRSVRSGAPRDGVWEALYLVETGEPYRPEARSRLTRKAAHALNAAAAEIRATGIDEAELRAAIAAWPRVMGDATCTAHAVAKHLPRLRAAARGLVARRGEIDEVAAEVERRLAARGA